MKLEVVGWVPYFMNDRFHEETNITEDIKFALVNDIRKHGYWLKAYDYDADINDKCHGLPLLSSGKYVWIGEDFAEELLRRAYGEYYGIFSCVAGVADNIPSEEDYECRKIKIVDVMPDAYDDLKNAVDDGANVEFIPYNFDPPYAYEGDIVRFCSTDEDGDEVFFDVEIIQDCNTNYMFPHTMSHAQARNKNYDVYDVLSDFLSYKKPSFPLKYRYDGLGDRQFVEIIQNTYGVIENDIQAIIFKKIEIFEEPFERPKEVSTDKVLARHHMEFVEAVDMKKQVRALADEIIERIMRGDFCISNKEVDNNLALFKQMFENLFIKRQWINCRDAEKAFAKISAHAYSTFESVMSDLCAMGYAYQFCDDEFYGIEEYYYACSDRKLPSPKAMTDDNKKLQKLIMQMLEVDTISSAGEISMRLNVDFDKVKTALDELVRIGDAEFLGGHYCATHEVERTGIADKIPTFEERGYKVATLKLANKKDKKDD